MCRRIRVTQTRRNVPCPIAGEATITLEAQGLIKASIGSCAQVRASAGKSDAPFFCDAAFEMMETPMLIKGEAATLAAVPIHDDELQDVANLVVPVESENRRSSGSRASDHAFHLLIAKASCNAVIMR